MAITLGAELNTAQDGISHAPRCKIVSSKFADEIPFAGNVFNTGSTNENDPATVATSTGRICSLYNLAGDLYMYYSDVDKLTWTKSEVIYTGGSFPVSDIAVVELADGNLGVTFFGYGSTSKYFYTAVITQTGTIVSGPTNQNTFDGTMTLYGLSVCAIDSGFFIAYCRLNASAYTIRGLTIDADFISNPSFIGALSISGISNDYEKLNLSLLAAASGRKYLFFDYEDDVSGSASRYNIFYSYSTDNGSSWSAAAQLTSYTDFTASGQHPYVAEQSDGTLAIVYNEDVSVLEINESTSGFCVNDVITNASFLVTRMFYIDNEKKLIACGRYTAAGTKFWHQTLVIDVDTWSIDKCYKQDGSPGFNGIWIVDHLWKWTWDAAGKYIVMSTDGYRRIAVINRESDTVTEYHFEDSVTYSITKNIDYTWQIDSVLKDAGFPKLDPDRDRLYYMRAGPRGTSGVYELGYIDLTETADPVTGLYTFNYVLHKTDAGDFGANYFFHLSVEENRAVICTNSVIGGSYKGWLAIHTLSSGALEKLYDVDSNAGFHYYGCEWEPVLKGDVVYSAISYSALYGQSARKGIMVIDTDTDTITYATPTYYTADDYGFQDLQIVSGGTKLLMASTVGDDFGGAVMYDLISKTWQQWGTDNVPGFDDPYATTVAYDVEDGVIFSANEVSITSVQKLIAFKEDGNFTLGKYIVGTVNGDHYDFGSEITLHEYFGGRELSAAYDDGNSLWNIWSDYDGDEYSLKWDRDSYAPDLAGYIPKTSTVQISWELDKPAAASFQLSRGDLFDPTNTLSILSSLCQKGRKVEIYFGEKVSGTTYWQKQGVFVLTGAAISYHARQHPIINIRCEDQSRSWDETVIIATEAFTSSTLTNVFEQILETHANMVAADYSLPTLSNAHAVYAQWVDQSLSDIMAELLDHFGAVGRYGQDGIYIVESIDLSAEVDHDYTGDSQTALVNYTPDDSMSSQINRVTVKCEGRTSFEVLWDEERIDSYSGTVGFWNKESDIRAYYSDDRTRKCRYPRLNVLESINDYPSFISMIDGNGDEKIDNIDSEETYCDIKIEAPNRGLYVFGFAALVAGLGYAAISCDGVVTGVCGYYIMSTNLAMSALIQSMTASNYRYELWARPIGNEKEMYQAIANDIVYQGQLGGMVVSYDLEDALGYTVAHCQMVADQELAVVKAQRRRVNFTKVAHLEDEIGDMLQINHPISLLAIKVYVSKLVRQYSTGGSGRFTDTIDGWRIV